MNTTPGYVDPSLAHTTAHSYTVHNREEKHLDKEIAKEAKRALKQEKLADKNSVKAEKEFAKAADKAQSHGMFAERSAMKHEEKAVKLAAAANFHHQAAVESHSEAGRAEYLASLPPRGTLPAQATPMVMTTTPVVMTTSGITQTSYNTIV